MTISSVYGGYPILLLPPDLDADSASETRTVDMDTFTGDAGALSQKTRGASPNFQSQISFLCESRDKWAELEVFLRACAGKAYPFYLPHWNDNIIVLSAGFFDFTIPYVGYTQNLFPIANFRKFLIIDRSNPLNVWGRPVDASVDNGDGTETLSGAVDFPYPSEFYNATYANGYRYSLMSLVRLDSDDLEIEYLSGEMVQVSVQVFHVPEG